MKTHISVIVKCEECGYTGLRIMKPFQVQRCHIDNGFGTCGGLLKIIAKEDETRKA